MPFSYFFEWGPAHQAKGALADRSRRRPRIHDGRPLGRLTDPECDPLESCTIVTTAPNSLLTEIGHHRCPVLLPPEDWDTWLTGDADRAASLLGPPASQTMRAHPVTTKVNNPGYQGDELLEVAEHGDG